MPWTPRELALLRLADAAEDQETPEERQARYSRESKARRRKQLGDEAWRQRVAGHSRAYHRRHRETQKGSK